jgi:5-methylcytosine-specific restriction protein A
MILLCWNRDQGDTWPLDEYEEFRRNCDRGESVPGTWSVGNRINIPVATECFLLIQGTKHPRGLVAQGITTSEPWEDEHYADPERTTNYVDIEWKSLLPIDDLIPVALLDRELPQIPWSSGGIRSSGFRIKPEFQKKLREIWEQISGEGEELEPGEMKGGNYIEGEVRTIVVNRYERDPKARQACLDHHGYICLACNVVQYTFIT